MVHHERSTPAELMPDCKGRTDCASCIPCSGLYINPPKGRHPTDFTVSDRVHGAPASQCKIRQSMVILQSGDEVEECLLVHRLDRAGDVSMPILKRLVRLSA